MDFFALIFRERERPNKSAGAHLLYIKYLFSIKGDGGLFVAYADEGGRDCENYLHCIESLVRQLAFAAIYIHTLLCVAKAQAAHAQNTTIKYSVVGKVTVIKLLRYVTSYFFK